MAQDRRAMPRLTARHFPAKSIRQTSRQAPRLSPRARQLLDIMVDQNLTLREAAEAMGIKPNTARVYFRHPRARAYYLEIIKEFREAQAARNLHTAVSIRDDGAVAPEAAHRKVALEAMRYIDGKEAGGINVNVGVGVGVGVNMPTQPGYLIDVSGDMGEVEAALAAARAPLRHQAEPADDYDVTIIEPASPPATIEVDASTGMTFVSPSERSAKETRLPPFDSRRRDEP